MLLESFSFQKALLYSNIIPQELQLNAEIYLALPVRGICQNPFRRSNLVIYFEFPILSIQSSILGMGKVSVLLKLLTFL